MRIWRPVVLFGATVLVLSGVTPAFAAQVPVLSKEKAHDLILQYLDDRADLVTKKADGKSGVALAGFPATGSLRQRLAEEAKQLDGVRAFVATTPSRGYRDAKVDVTVDSLVSEASTETHVAATELTKLYFGHDDPAAPQYEAYKLEHDFTLIWSGNEWILTSATPHLKDGPPPPTQAKAPASRRAAQPGVSQPIKGLQPASVTTATQAGEKSPGLATDKKFGKMSSAGVLDYNYQNMYNYASAYWDNYNTSYRSFGNDCTNFISQIMSVGGWEQTGGDPTNNANWWYIVSTQSYSWAGAQNWGLFAQVYSHRTAPLGNVYEMLTTDVLQVDWDHPDEEPGEEEGNLDHTMIVTGYLGTAGAADEIYLTYHSTDRWNVPFWGWLLPQTEARDVWYAHRT
jgi:hypothetical protein